MAFTSFADLTLAEALAWAAVKFGRERFTHTNLTASLATAVGEQVTYRSIRFVENLLLEASECFLVESAAGPRGGRGYAVTRAGEDFIGEVVLPAEKLAYDEFKTLSAKTLAARNPGPILTALQNFYPEANNTREFISSVFDYWLDKGRVTPRQAEVLESLAAEQGVIIDGASLAGQSPIEWRRPYIEQRRRQDEEGRVKILAAWQAWFADLDDFLNSVQVGRSRLHEALSSMGGDLQLVTKAKAIMSAYGMAGACSVSGMKQAFRGEGSRANRVSLALIIGERPSELWPVVPERIKAHLSDALYRCPDNFWPPGLKSRVTQLLGAHVYSLPGQGTRDSDDVQWAELMDLPPLP